MEMIVNRIGIIIKIMFAAVITVGVFMLAGCGAAGVPHDKGKSNFTEKESTGTWYEQSPRRARIRIKDGYLDYDTKGGWNTMWRGGMFFENKEDDGTYRFSANVTDLLFPDILYDPKEDVIMTVDKDGTESVFKRTKYVPTDEEISEEVKLYPAPDESFCGKWTGSHDDVSGGYQLILDKPDGSGNWPVSMTFSWFYDQGGGMNVDTVDVDGAAQVSDDGAMILSGAYMDGSDLPESDRQIKIMFEQYDEGLRAIVLDCDHSRIQSGDWFNLIREEGKGETGEYDGTWYAQDDSGATLIINKGLMLLEYGDIEDEADFEPKEEDDRIVLAEVSEGDIPFWFYEINYYPDDERIEAYTWPMLDDDGGYKRTVFKRDEFEPGDENMMGLLYGDWEIMDDGELIQEPGIRRDIVHFSSSDYHMMRFIRPNGDMTTFSIELTDVFEENPKAYDRMRLSNKFVSGVYSWDEVRPEQSFQIMIANNLGIDYMMLRELGDERTGFASDGLRYDRSADGIWFFRRPDPNEYDGEYESLITTPSTVGIEDEIRMKNTSFYAIKWQEFGNSCTLQWVEVTPTIATIDGEDENALAYSIPDAEYAYSAVNYEYSGRDNMAHGGYFTPGLVNVTTDNRGQITEMVGFKYARDGMYYEHGEKIFDSE